jgi:hypothetical protein
MSGRHHVPPPGAAPAPNVATGRQFWTNWEGNDVCQPAAPPITPAVIDLTKPNLSRLALADTLYGTYRTQGYDDATARSLADARALVMIP